MRTHSNLLHIVCVQAIILFSLFMISGCEQKDLFKNSQFSMESLVEIGNNPIDPNHQTGTITFPEWMKTNGVTYKGCEGTALILHADKGLAADENITACLECNGQCEFYSDNLCTARITTATISSGELTSPIFYVKPTAAYLSLKTSDKMPYYKGSSVDDIPVHVTYEDIDAQYMWSINNISEFGNDIAANNIQAGDIWVFQTKEGYRGKLLIKSVSTVYVDGDTWNFDEVTWGPLNNVISSTSEEPITACSAESKGKCYIDMSMPPMVVNEKHDEDLWWENSTEGPSGILYFVPRTPAVFRLLN
jgi:hypothetical protein